MSFFRKKPEEVVDVPEFIRIANEEKNKLNEQIRELVAKTIQQENEISSLKQKLILDNDAREMYTRLSEVYRRHFSQKEGEDLVADVEHLVVEESTGFDRHVRLKFDVRITKEQYRLFSQRDNSNVYLRLLMSEQELKEFLESKERLNDT